MYLNMSPSSLIRTRASLVCMEELLKMGVLPEEGRKNVAGLITFLQKEILAFLLQKQFRK
jgi:hypothetical protein